MNFESPIQNLAVLFLLRTSLLPTIIRQPCRSTCVGFLPMVFSPIGLRRFRYETLLFILRNTCELNFSEPMKRSQTRIWDPGENCSDSKKFWIENRFWSDLTPFVFDDEEPRRWPINSLDWVLNTPLRRRIIGSEKLSNLPDLLLCRIPSELSTKDSIRTSVLSKFWRTLWAHVPVLDLDFNDFQDEDFDMLESIDGYMEFNKELDLKRFKMIYDVPWEHSHDDFVWRLDQVVKRSVCHLTVLNRVDLNEALVRMSLSLYSCVTLVDLTLYGVVLDNLESESVYTGSRAVSMDVISDLKTRRLLNDGREVLSELSNILISTKQQDTGLSPTTSTSLHFIQEVMLKAFWSLISKLIANKKYVKEGHNRFHLLARKAFDSRVTLHSFIEIVSISYICVQWLLWNFVEEYMHMRIGEECHNVQ